MSSPAVPTQPPYTPVDFKPSQHDEKYYLQGVVNYGPGTWMGPTVNAVNPFFCPTLYTTRVMQEVLAAYGLESEIFYEGPFGFGPGNPVRETVQVPKLRFPNGQTFNPGCLSETWTNYPALWAENTQIPMARQLFNLTVDGQ